MIASLVIFGFVYLSDCVLRSKFKTCQQSGFCNRVFQHSLPEDRFELGQLVCKNAEILALIHDKHFSTELEIKLTAAKQNRLRLHATERTPRFPRFDVFKDAWSDEQQPPNPDTNAVGKQLNSTACELKFPSGFTVTANFQPLKIIVHDQKGVSVITINDKNSFYIEPHLKQTDLNEGQDENVSENFDGHEDTLPHGHQAVSFDATFHDFSHIYGIPEHADTFSLKTDNEKYRLYNLDVFEYELHNPMALYGSIPCTVVKNTKLTLGLLFLNAAETWVNLNKQSPTSVLSVLGFGGSSRKGISTRWVAESGNIDVTFMLGPAPSDVLYQIADTTGFAPIPPLFSLAFQQSRWNYENERDVIGVDAGFDLHDIPYDTLWLDIEYSDHRQYFHFNKDKFPDPQRTIDNLASKGRTMVNVVDPHIRKNEAYYVYQEAIDKGMDTKNKHGNTYVGWCWPGDSIYPDYMRKDVRDWYASLFDLQKYSGTTSDLHTWVDMNEPSVFNGPEVTAPKDVKHGQWEHRDVHNIYGLMCSDATYNGGLVRTQGRLRPFVLSRSFFAGSQKFGAVWTGDNLASWEHLAISVPMLLSLNIVGMSFSGADVGGFFGNPDPELFNRWFQLGSMQPFFRAHSHIETNRREPWSFGSPTTDLVRTQIQRRYRYLPYIYTLFREHFDRGAPVMRPLWYEFPDDQRALDIETSYMLGPALLISPILEPHSSAVSVYFPQSQPSTYWWGLFDNRVYSGGERVVQMHSESDLPMFQRSGTIVPTWERPRRASSKMLNDPITLTVVVDGQGRARGSFYFDDTETFSYVKGNYSIFLFDFHNGVLSGGKFGEFPTDIWLERVLVHGFNASPITAVVTSLGKTYELAILKNGSSFTIRKPDVKLTDGFVIKLTAA